MTKNIVAKLKRTRNNHEPQAAFVEAFVAPPETPPNITLAWIARTTVAIDALIWFRSALHRWQAYGRIPDDEFVLEGTRLETANLDSWFEGLLLGSLAVNEVDYDPNP